MTEKFMKFICYGCNRECETETSDEEALEEYQENFGHLEKTDDEVVSVCQECYKKFMKDFRKWERDVH